MKNSKLILITLLLPLIGAAMKPRIPELLVYASPNHEIEVHTQKDKNSVLILQKNKKQIPLGEKFYPASVLSLTGDKFVAVGSLGDSGVGLGRLRFYDSTGMIKTLDLKESISDLEELAKSNRDATNFPWVSGLDFDGKDLQIWICNTVLATISTQDYSVKVSKPGQPPKWAKTDNKSNPQTNKHIWKLDYRD